MVGTSTWTKDITRWTCRKRAGGMNAKDIVLAFKAANPRWVGKPFTEGSVKYILGSVHTTHFGGKRSDVNCCCNKHVDGDHEELDTAESANPIGPLLRPSSDNRAGNYSPYQKGPYQSNQIDDESLDDASDYGLGSRASSTAMPEARMVSEHPRHLQKNFDPLDDGVDIGMGTLYQANLQTPWREGVDPMAMNYYSQAKGTVGQQESSSRAPVSSTNFMGSNATAHGVATPKENQQYATPNKYPAPTKSYMDEDSRRQKTAQQGKTLRDLAARAKRSRMMASMDSENAIHNTPDDMTIASMGAYQSAGPASYSQDPLLPHYGANMSGFGSSGRSQAEHANRPQTGTYSHQVSDLEHGIPLGTDQKNILVKVSHQAKQSTSPGLQPQSPSNSNNALTAAQRRTLAQSRKQVQPQGKNEVSQSAAGTSQSTTATPPAKSTDKPLRGRSGQNPLLFETPIQVQTPHIFGRIVLPETPDGELYVDPLYATPVQDGCITLMANTAKEKLKLVNWLEIIGEPIYVMLPRDKLDALGVQAGTQTRPANQPTQSVSTRKRGVSRPLKKIAPRQSAPFISQAEQINAAMDQRQEHISMAYEQASRQRAKRYREESPDDMGHSAKRLKAFATPPNFNSSMASRLEPGAETFGTGYGAQPTESLPQVAPPVEGLADLPQSVTDFIGNGYDVGAVEAFGSDFNFDFLNQEDPAGFAEGPNVQGVQGEYATSFEQGARPQEQAPDTMDQGAYLGHEAPGPQVIAEQALDMMDQGAYLGHEALGPQVIAEQALAIIDQGAYLGHEAPGPQVAEQALAIMDQGVYLGHEAPGPQVIADGHSTAVGDGQIGGFFNASQQPIELQGQNDEFPDWDLDLGFLNFEADHERRRRARRGSRDGKSDNDYFS